ncbi:N-acetyltransferase [Bacillus salacetis]|uniref:N-acetyltransferase n=1 Tax=Bacillus salacetis TaxID=2315464 RepID=A0A3A1R522_9BACI|nr:GNAT family N-acetyltransferase [Bacillus salacetis]RIW38296.1 N-acetyltransferase [Bacillus salacetis]
MIEVSSAKMTDLKEIVQVDSEIVGSTKRYSYIKGAIESGCCLIVKENGRIGGFLIYHTNFFDHSFISLIIVSPSKRRRGYASRLLMYLEMLSPTDKVFSSTNRSNHDMQFVFKYNGYKPSGIIENLDEEDPELVYYKAVKLPY